jgi:hypothetical protein
VAELNLEQFDPQLLRSLAIIFADSANDATASDADDPWIAMLNTAVRTIPGTEHASVTVLRDGKFNTPSATDPIAEQVDQLQYEFKSGPCVDAAVQETVFRTGDLDNDPRWPEFGPRAAERHGISSMLSLRLFVDDEATTAALNLYSTLPDAFSEKAELFGLVFATRAALLVVAAQQRQTIAGLEFAVRSNREIGVAIGILMTQLKVTGDAAFDLLRIASQHSHRKLREVAQEVIETGTLSLPRLKQT